MTEKKVSWSQRITPIQREFIDRILDTFQEDHKLSSKGEALYLFIQEHSKIEIGKIYEPEVLTPEDKERHEILSKICNRGLMQIIGGIPTCGQKTFPRGIQSQIPFIYQRNDLKGKYKKGEIMSVEDITSTCELCKQSFTEDKRIKDMMSQMTMILDKDQIIDLYFCYHPQLENHIFTAFKKATIYCAKFNRYVSLEKNCLIKDCSFMEILNIQAPPPKPKEG